MLAEALAIAAIIDLKKEKKSRIKALFIKQLEKQGIFK
jgi:hypothetical protein